MSNWYQMSKNQDSLTVARKLLIAWGCGLLWESGLLVTLIAFLGWALSGIATFSSHSPITAGQALGMVSGLLASIAGPILMSLALLRPKRHAIRNGILSVVISWLGLWIGWIAAGEFNSWVGSGSSLVVGEQRLVLQQVSDSLNILLPLILGATGAITVILLPSVRVSPTRHLLGLSVGLIIGLLFFSISWFVLGMSLITPFIWVNAIYFLGMIAGRSRGDGTLLWILFLLVTFGLSSVIASQFCLSNLWPLTCV